MSIMSRAVEVSPWRGGVTRLRHGLPLSPRGNGGTCRHGKGEDEGGEHESYDSYTNSRKINLPHLDDSAEKAGTYRQKFDQIGADSTKFDQIRVCFYFFLDLMTASESAHFGMPAPAPAAYQELALAPASWNTVGLKRHDFTE